MIGTLGVDSYQSIDTAFMKFGMINLIVGPNFSGKSAILRALRAACLGQTGDEFIRHGADEAAVGVTFEAGINSVDWHKQRKVSASYHLMQESQSREFLKVGQHVPEDVTKMLGVRPLQIDTSWTVTPQFHMQWDQPLVGQSGSRMARLLGTMTKLDVVVQAQILNRKDRERASRDAAAAEAEAELLRSQLAQLDWVEGARASVDETEQSIVDARAALTRLNLDVEKVAAYFWLRLEVDALAKRYQYAAPMLAEAQRLLPQLEKDRELVDKKLALDEESHLMREQQRGLIRIHQRAEAEYKAAGAEAGVCDACPWR